MRHGIRLVLIGSLVLCAGAALSQPGPRFGAGVTPGWQLMTPEERAAHQKAMSGFTTYEDCAAYREQHHADMASRMKERGQAMPAQPRRDLCGGLPKKAG